MNAVMAPPTTIIATNWRWLLLLSILALLPFGSVSELPLLIAALIGIVDGWKSRSWLFAADGGRLLGVLFLAYWLPELLSAFDSVAPAKSWTEVVADLRFLPFGIFALISLQTDTARRRLLQGSAIVLLLWTVDALIQAGFGIGLGGRMLSDRVSGIFSDDNLKLGPVLATLAPLLLWWGWQRWRWLGLATLWLALAVAVLLAGARAAWLSFALVTLLMLWKSAASPRRFVLAAIAAGLAAVLVFSVSYATSERVQARVERSLLALQGTRAGVDGALALRLPIWSASIEMAKAHPINGVGVRAFRFAYPDYARDDDIWLTIQPGRGASHAHQIILEIWTETGVIGVLCWLAGCLYLIRHGRRADVGIRHVSWPWAMALVSMCFPLNTHLAFYSNFWGVLFWWLLAILAAHLIAPSRSSMASVERT